MAKRIIWSSLASEIFSSILLYYYQRNGNKVYSRKLNSRVKKTILLLSNYPYLGKPTEINSVRELLEVDLKIIYQIKDHEIVILLIWDVRQNPENLNINQMV
jgi:plasmid stabilization system protein ParE